MLICFISSIQFSYSSFKPLKLPMILSTLRPLISLLSSPSIVVNICLIHLTNLRMHLLFLFHRLQQVFINLHHRSLYQLLLFTYLQGCFHVEFESLHQPCYFILRLLPQFHLFQFLDPTQIMGIHLP